MKRILIAAVLLGSLVQAGVASAGCNATVGVAPPPTGIAPGTTWTAEMTVLQHGVQPLPNADTAHPTLTIVNDETGARKTFTSPADRRPGGVRRRRRLPGRGNLELRGLRRLHRLGGRHGGAVRDAQLRLGHRRGAPAGGGDAAFADRHSRRRWRQPQTGWLPGAGPSWAALAGPGRIVALPLMLRGGVGGRSPGWRLALDGDPAHEGRAPRRGRSGGERRRRAPTRSTRRRIAKRGGAKAGGDGESRLLEAERRPGAARRPAISAAA